MIKASKILHRNKTRIRVDFPYDLELVSKLKQIPDACWSKTMKAWHVPYTREAFMQLKSLFPDIDYNTPPTTIIDERSEITTPPSPPHIPHIQAPNEQLPQKKLNIENVTLAKEEPISPEKLKLTKKINAIPEVVQPLEPNVAKPKRDIISIEITSKNVFIKMPKNDADMLFIRSFKFVLWDMHNFCWVVPNHRDNAAKIVAYFQSRNPEIKEYNTAVEAPVTPANYAKNEMLVVNNFRVLKVYFAYIKDLLIEVKKIPFSFWNADGHYWSIPASEKFIGELKMIAERNSLVFIYQEEVKPKVKMRISQHDIENYRKCPKEYAAKLKELRYSDNTLATYTNMFEEFINHYPETEIDDVTDEMIVDFLRYLVIERNISGSYQNQSINAIKFYYERVLGGQRKIYTIDRPRKEKILPEVLSEEEVIKILNATENLKHKAIFMTIYSAGLRIGELINLRLKDIDSGRMQIRVEQAKGKKDRYTLLGTKTLEVLRKYVIEYKPKVWLFEGIKGEQYSTSSIQANLKNSVEKAGIRKRVTVHTLRHSFATHLLEAGTDIRYIQSLLGHQNSKTTEIYTHITTKGFGQIVSPLDKLKI